MNFSVSTNRFVPCKLKFILVLSLIFVPVFFSFSQENYQSFYARSLKMNNTGMFVLGGWALANISVGAFGWAKGQGENKYFHQMNVFWNVVNLSIAGFALYNNLHTDLILTNEEMIKKHIRNENLYLINAALDVGYIGAGALMRHFASRSSNRTDLLRGYGSSIILQGSFLLVFDAVMFGVLKSYRCGFLNGINLSLSHDVYELQFRLNF